MTQITKEANRKNAKSKAMLLVLNNKALILLMLVFLISTFVTNYNTVTVYNLTSLMRQLSVYTIVAAGYTIIFAAGMMDLSVGEVLSLCGVIYAVISLSYPVWVAILACFVVGVFCEFLNGFMIRFFKIPGFVLTLAIAQIYKGISHLITDGRNVSGLSDLTKVFGQGRIFNFIPNAFLIAVIVILMLAILISRTIYGRHVLATGGNGEAANVSGIKVEILRVSAYMVAGICASVGAIVLTGRVGFASATAGNSYTMDCIAAVVIGGTSMRGGKAKVVGTLFGVALIVVINNMLNLLNVSTYWQWIAKGFIIILAIVLDALTEQFVNKQRAKA